MSTCQQLPEYQTHDLQAQEQVIQEATMFSDELITCPTTPSIGSSLFERFTQIPNKIIIVFNNEIGEY